MKATHIFTGTTDINGEASPFTGLACALLAQSGMDRAGFNGEVALLCTFEELLVRYEAARVTRAWQTTPYTLADMREFHADPTCLGADLVAKGQGFPVVSVNVQNDLTPASQGGK
jgi:hypothetical protein